MEPSIQFAKRKDGFKIAYSIFGKGPLLVIPPPWIGDRDNLNFNPDGSIDILIQNKSPEKGDSNWLPAPTGAFAVTMRLYMPKKEFLRGEWKLPPVNKVIEKVYIFLGKT
jgi:hypothetical protein